ncbi:hypothetical protein NFI96_003134 [Prochilodus magdalenae]|nr:hypothetical protein NFI96_003134 [Prochilodus magdalenae]
MSTALRVQCRKCQTLFAIPVLRECEWSRNTKIFREVFASDNQDDYILKSVSRSRRTESINSECRLKVLLSMDTMFQGNNSGNTSTCEIQDNLPWLLLPISYSVICCIGLVSNTISMFVFVRRHADTSMAVYMRHLTLADSLLVLCLPLRIYYHNHEGPFYLCKAVGVFFYINMYASISFLSLISLDRYLKINKPVWVFRIQKVRWSRIASNIIWVSLILGSVLFFVGKKDDQPCDKICFHFHNKGTLAGGINLAVVGLFGILILLFIIFYVKIALKLRTMDMGNCDPKAQSRKKHLILKTYLVPAIFTLCFLPYHLVRTPYVLAQMNVISELGSKQMLHSWNEITLLLSTLNSCLDPIIYYFLSSTYRKTIICAIKGDYSIRAKEDVYRAKAVHSNVGFSAPLGCWTQDEIHLGMEVKYGILQHICPQMLQLGL